jgi:signal peptidase II
VIGLLASGGLLLLLDQWSKKAVRLLTSDQTISFTPLVNIRHVANVKKIYKNRNTKIVLMLMWLWALASTLILRYSGAWFQGEACLVGLGFALGGAAGNLIDIWRRESVVDFIDLRWWPVFNLADVGIVGGLLLAFWR